jgi:hypothetical protein
MKNVEFDELGKKASVAGVQSANEWPEMRMEVTVQLLGILSFLLLCS